MHVARRFGSWFARCLSSAAVCAVLAPASAQERGKPPTPEEAAKLREQKLASRVFTLLPWQRDPVAAMTLAKQEDKLLLLYVTFGGRAHPPSENFEADVLASPEFEARAGQFVPFVHVFLLGDKTSLPAAYGNANPGVPPAVQILDGDGRVYGGAAKNLEQVTKRVDDAVRLRQLWRQTAKTPAEEIELLLLELELEQFDPATVAARADQLPLTIEQRRLIAIKRTDLEVMPMLRGMKVAEETAGVSRRIAEIAAAGRRPSEPNMRTFWRQVLQHADAVHDAELAVVAYGRLRPGFDFQTGRAPGERANWLDFLANATKPDQQAGAARLGEPAFAEWLRDFGEAFAAARGSDKDPDAPKKLVLACWAGPATKCAATDALVSGLFASEAFRALRAEFVPVVHVLAEPARAGRWERQALTPLPRLQILDHDGAPWARPLPTVEAIAAARADVAAMQALRAKKQPQPADVAQLLLLELRQGRVDRIDFDVRVAALGALANDGPLAAAIAAERAAHEYDDAMATKEAATRFERLVAMVAAGRVPAGDAAICFWSQLLAQAGAQKDVAEGLELLAAKRAAVQADAALVQIAAVDPRVAAVLPAWRQQAGVAAWLVEAKDGAQKDGAQKDGAQKDGAQKVGAQKVGDRKDGGAAPGATGK